MFSLMSQSKVQIDGGEKPTIAIETTVLSRAKLKILERLDGVLVCHARYILFIHGQTIEVRQDFGVRSISVTRSCWNELTREDMAEAGAANASLGSRKEVDVMKSKM